MKNEVALVGFYSSIVAALAAIGYSVVQIMQVIGLLGTPLDGILIYGFSLCIAPPFLLAILALHYFVPDSRKFWSHAALLFAVMYTIYVVLMYTVQLATVIPFSNENQANDVLLVRPHSFFWTLDALGYICMGLSTLFAAFVFTGQTSQKLLRLFLLLNGLMVPFISFAYFYPEFSTWVLFIGSPWIITAPGSMVLLAIYFKKNFGIVRFDEERTKASRYEQKSVSSF